MPSDSSVESNQADGDKAKEFGRVSDRSSPTKQDLNLLTKYDLLFVPNNIAVRCIGCMDYIWEHEYTSDEKNCTSLINEFSFNSLVLKIIDHHLTCDYWNK